MSQLTKDEEARLIAKLNAEEEDLAKNSEKIARNEKYIKSFEDRELMIKKANLAKKKANSILNRNLNTSNKKSGLSGDSLNNVLDQYNKRKKIFDTSKGAGSVLKKAFGELF